MTSKKLARSPKRTKRTTAAPTPEPVQAPSVPTTPVDESATRQFHGTFAEISAMVDRIRAERAETPKEPPATSHDNALFCLDGAMEAAVRIMANESDDQLEHIQVLMKSLAVLRGIILIEGVGAQS